jgi:hypothetical protein
MHSARELRSSFFEIVVDGQPAEIGDLFERFDELDRLGVVMSRPCGAVGASALITATITAFYDFQRARGGDFFVYPDYYLFHAARRLGDHARLDIWPSRKEVVVPEEPQRILAAVNDRGITRLVVEDGEPGEPTFDREEIASARARVRTCLAYSASGRVGDADVRIASNSVSEGYVEDVLDPEARIAKLRAEGDGGQAQAIAARASEVAPDVRERIRLARRELVQDGVPVETYRRIGLNEALALLGS